MEVNPKVLTPSSFEEENWATAWDDGLTLERRRRQGKAYSPFSLSHSR